MKGKTVAIIGGGSGIGLCVAKGVIERGGNVIIGGRSPERLQAALVNLGSSARAYEVDSAKRETLAPFFASCGPIDHLFTPGASYALGAFRDISDDVAESPMTNKFWGQYYAVKAALPYLSKGGSVVLMAGGAGAHAVPAAAAYAACNSAIESLARSLALELAPLRINTVSPGTTDSDLWRNRPADMREKAYASFSQQNALGRVGTVEEVAGAVLFLMENSFTTGATLYPDGGFVMR